MLWILVCALLGAALVYAVHVFHRRQEAMGPAWRLFFERTGYRYADIPGGSVEQQVARAERLMRQMAHAPTLHMMRDFGGVRVHWVQRRAGFVKGDRLGAFDWVVPLPGKARVLLHLADKRLAGAGKNAQQSTAPIPAGEWRPAYVRKISIADEDLDRRFACYGQDAAAVQTVLAAPRLRALLLTCAEVDVLVAEDEVRFSDPQRRNIDAAVGGAVGKVSIGRDPSRLMELSIPVHDRMAEILALLVDSCGLPEDGATMKPSSRGPTAAGCG